MQQINCGVYLIRNTDSGKCYIGSAVNLRVRWNSHQNALKRQAHDNRHLQNAWNMYGSQAFVFAPLLYCHESDRVWFEQRALDSFTVTRGRSGLYNLSPTASCVRGVQRTEETRQKLSEAGKGRRHSPESRAKMRLAALGNKRNLGRKASPEARAKLSAVMKARTVTWGDKISAGQKGRVMTPEHRAKLSEAAKRRKWSESQRQVMRERMKGNKIGLGNKNGAGYVYTLEQREARRLRAIGNKNGAGNKNRLGRHLSEATKQKLREARLRTVAKKRGALQFAQASLPLLSVVILLLVPVLTRAQPTQDDPMAKALEQAVSRLAVAEEKNLLLQDRLKAKDTTILGLEGVVQLRDRQLELEKSANKDRATVNTGDAVMLRACEQQLSRSDAEIARLRNPPFFKRLFSTESLVGFGVGYGAASLKK